MNKQIMDEAALKRAVMRISHEIIEKNKGTENIVLVGIKRRGIHLGQMIRDNIMKIEGIEIPFQTLDIHFYRDDLTTESDSPVYKEEISSTIPCLCLLLFPKGTSTRQPGTHFSSSIM